MNKCASAVGPVVRWCAYDARGTMVVESTGKAARVRAAAPELLEALERIRDGMADDRVYRDCARAAIAKAKGE